MRTAAVYVSYSYTWTSRTLVWSHWTHHNDRVFYWLWLWVNQLVVSTVLVQVGPSHMCSIGLTDHL